MSQSLRNQVRRKEILSLVLSGLVSCTACNSQQTAEQAKPGMAASEQAAESLALSEVKSPDDPEAAASVESSSTSVRRDGDGAIIEVDFRGSEIGDEDLAELSQLPRLRSLLLADTAITDAALPLVGTIKTLQNLDMRGCPISDSGFKHLVDLKNLKVLKLSGKNGQSDVSDDAMVHIAKLENLKVLAVDYLWISEDGLAEINGLEQLQELYMANTSIGDEAIEMMKSFPQLRKLRLAGTHIGADGIAALPRLSKLEDLDISECAGVLDDAIKPIGEITSLRKLNLWRLNISNEGISTLKNLTNLTSLNVDNTRISDEGLSTLSGLKNLTFLHLGSTSITDDGLVHLEGLQSLENLIVTRTGVTAEGANELQRKLPQAKIQLKYIAQ